MIFVKELINQIVLPRTRIVANSAFSSEWRGMHAVIGREPPNVSQAFIIDYGEDEAYYARSR